MLKSRRGSEGAFWFQTSPCNTSPSTRTCATTRYTITDIETGLRAGRPRDGRASGVAARRGNCISISRCVRRASAAVVIMEEFLARKKRFAARPCRANSFRKE